MSTVSGQGILPAKLFPIESSIMCLIVALSLPSSPLQAQNAVKAGRFHVEHPTLLNLGIEWAIEGDANRNATVIVQFRPVGESKWRDALPPLRLRGEKVFRRRQNLHYTPPHGFSCSMLAAISPNGSIMWIR